MRQPMTIRLDSRVLSLAKKIATAKNRTLTNYIETLIQRDIATHYRPHQEQRIESNKMDELFIAYSSGKISKRELQEKTGIEWFGDVLQELGKRGLKLPIVDSRVHFNEKQMALYETIFSGKSL